MIDGWRPHDLAKFSETFADHWYNYNENWAANEKGTIPKIFFFLLQFSAKFIERQENIGPKIIPI